MKCESLRVGSICWATAQGLGHLMRWFFDHGIITDPAILQHPAAKRVTYTEWYPPGTPLLRTRPFAGQPEVEALLDRVDLMLFFETPFDWDFLNHCHSRGVKTALVPMYEWTPKEPPAWFDLVIAPSLLDRDYFPGSVFLPIPVDPSYWRQRTTARRFLHNAGNVGHREHKGTRELIRALPHVRSRDFKITVRAQDGWELRKIVNEVRVQDGYDAARDPRVTVVHDQLPYAELWRNHDVLVAPEKFNGLSLPLQEGYAAGMLVMTTDRYPTNTWLPREVSVPNGRHIGDGGGYEVSAVQILNPLIEPKEYRRARVSGSCHEFDEAVVEPEAVAAKIDEWFGRDIHNYSLAAKSWAKSHSWESLTPAWRKTLEDCVNGKAPADGGAVADNVEHLGGVRI